MKGFIKKYAGIIKEHAIFKIVCLLVLVITLIGLSGHTAHAEIIEKFLGVSGFWDLVAQGTAFLVNTALSVASWFVALTGMLLNVSINITMHMKDFVNSTPAIYDVWKTIRDISGMFIIFILLYAAIRMILGQDAKLGNTIKNIVIAGVLINFSFFVTALLIDTSNVVSLQLYRAITPGQPDIGQLIAANNSTGAMSAIVGKLFDDGGLSAIFMQSLQIQSVFNPKNINLGANSSNSNGATPFKIILIGVTGIVIMLVAGLSFLFASLAFIVRLVLLLLLLAFSPIWFVAGIIPQLKEYADEWKKILIGQLTFMPAYLLMMYAALLILTKSNIFKNGASGGLWQGNSTTGVPTEFVTFAINAVFIIIMLNVPLLVAIKLGGSMGGLMDMKKLGGMFDAKKIWGGVGGFAGRHTAGRFASGLDKQLANTRIGNMSLVRDIRAGTTGALAKSKFGSSRSYEDQAKINEDVAKQRELIRTGNTEMDKKRKAGERSNELNAIIASGTTAPNKYQDIIKKMNEKEKLALGGKNLKNIEVLKHLKKSDFEAIKKSDDISDEDKAEIGTLRLQALRHTIDQGHSQEDFAEHMLKNMETDDIMKLESSYLEDPHLIKHLTAGQLKKMADEKLNPNVKKVIGDTITDWATNPLTVPISGGDFHHALGFITKNRAQWS